MWAQQRCRGEGPGSPGEVCPSPHREMAPEAPRRAVLPPAPGHFPAEQLGDNYRQGCAGGARCGWIWCASPSRAGRLPPYHLLSHLLGLGEKQQQMLSRWARSSLYATVSPLILPAPLVSQEREHPQEKAEICVSSSPAPVPPFLHPDHPSKPGWHCLSSETLRCHGSPASQQD